MAFWQIALLAFVAAWMVQSFGVWLQMQHYQKTFADLRAQWTDGLMGAGAAPGRLGKGVIVLMVVNPDGIVRKTCMMQGRSVFTKFKDRSEFDGLSISDVKSRAQAAAYERNVGNAIVKAIEQIEKIGFAPAAAMTVAA